MLDVMRTIFAACVALAIAACGTSGGGAQPAGGGTQPGGGAIVTPAPQATAQVKPADATQAPSPSKAMDDDPYGYGY